jgi:inorganic phosphate transporter, PiT family
VEIIVVVTIIVGFYMAWNIGANDVANSMACAVGSRALTVFWAVVLASICNFCGAVLVGSHVADTVRKGIIDTQAFTNDPRMLAHGMLCALLAAAVWLNLSSYLGMPVSTTHSIVGAVVGFGILEAGLHHVHWHTMEEIVASWFISPLVGGIMAFVIFKLILRYILTAKEPVAAARKGVPICVFVVFATIILSIIYKGLAHLHLNLKAPSAIILSILGGLGAAGISMLLARRNRSSHDKLSLTQQLRQVEKTFVVLVVITSCTVAFAHGANDVANAIGPLAAVVEIVKTNRVPGRVPIDLWLLVFGGFGIASGLATFGYRVMRVVGTQVTDITPSRGIAANLAGMMTVLTCSKMGLPVSTTHTMIGAILGVGLARGITAINRTVVKSIFTSWLGTVPAAALLTVLFYLIGRWLIW